MSLAKSDGTMLHASGHDQELSLAKSNHTVAELHVELPVEHEEELVFGVVLVPHEAALEFHQVSAGRSPALPASVGLPSVVGSTCWPFNSPTILGAQ